LAEGPLDCGGFFRGLAPLPALLLDAVQGFAEPLLKRWAVVLDIQFIFQPGNASAK
jgi:hypothetical protein